MQKNFTVIAGFMLVAVLVAALSASCISTPNLSQDGLEASVVEASTPGASTLGASTAASGFERADASLELSLPEDFGPHPDYQTEWWYYTGNLDDEAGHHFGYQLTFFRRALIPAKERTRRESGWASDQVYLAHFALSDVEGKRHHAFERFSRGAPELAGAEPHPSRSG